PLPPLPVDPFLPSWAWGLGGAFCSAVAMTIPMYCCYFRRLASAKRKYKSQALGGPDPSFMDLVVKKVDPRLVRRFIGREDGARELTEVE
ncbi:unnamed protein product, partial [Polarella glacialis]